jgi:hypothetical protein
VSTPQSFNFSTAGVYQKDERAQPGNIHSRIFSVSNKCGVSRYPSLCVLFFLIFKGQMGNVFESEAVMKTTTHNSLKQKFRLSNISKFLPSGADLDLSSEEYEMRKEKLRLSSIAVRSCPWM